jgi:LuxR family transcriptional regulator, maltose regulon positive regulatory protein
MLLLRTKLFVPRLQQRHVARAHLLRRLNDGLQRTLTLISAPAGFGKTTLVSAWVAADGRPVAWLSLDEGDNDPFRFLAYVVAALQSVAPQIGSGIQHALQSAQPPPMEALLTALINEISTLPEQVVVVLDDYHLIESEAVDRAVTFLLEHVPEQLHLVIATRQDPPLPLARLRARGQLSELRAVDLRFAADEATEFLNHAMGLSLSTTDIAALEERTEGWIAGLQLAALSLRDRQNATEFIRAFAGEHRYVADYLVEEVLQRQPATLRDFLLQSAILDRLHGPLCDAVTGQRDGHARLESLARGNFFVVPLDDQRQWYRYHHLFANMLRAQLMDEHPELVATLHQRASAWHEQHGSLADAIRHALAAGDPERAAEMIERALPALRRGRLGVTLLGWLKALPDEVLRCRPVLSAAYAWALLEGGELEAVESRLQDAERWLSQVGKTSPQPGSAPGAPVVVDAEEFRQLPGTIAVYRAGHAYLLGDTAATERYAGRALDLTREDDHLARGSAAALLALARWTSGDLAAAQRHYADGMASLRQAGLLSDVVNGANTVAAIAMAQGRLRDAERTLESAGQRASELGDPGLHGMADFLIGLADVRLERNALDAAGAHLQHAQELALGTGATYNRARWYVALARITLAQGNLDAALIHLDEAERVRVPDFFPNARPVAALRARVWLAQGSIDRAAGWAREQGLATEDDLSYLREYEHITLLRVLLAQQTSDRSTAGLQATMSFLTRLVHAAEAGGRMGSVIELLILQALAYAKRGDAPAALVPLERALTLAEPEGFVRVFVDEGAPVAALLEAAAKRGIAPAYTRLLLEALNGTPSTAPLPLKQDLIEPLSERELDVLRLLATDMDGPDIANELMVSLNTMRTHTKNIYSKLGVNNRRAAVSRAAELKLLARSRKP